MPVTINDSLNPRLLINLDLLNVRNSRQRDIRIRLSCRDKKLVVAARFDSCRGIQSINYAQEEEASWEFQKDNLDGIIVRRNECDIARLINIRGPTPGR